MKEYPTSSIEFFEHADGKIYDVCQAYYLHYLKPSTTSEEAAKKLREFYEACGFIQSDQTLKIETNFSECVSRVDGYQSSDYRKNS